MKNRYVLLGDVLLIPLAAFAAFAGRFDLGFVGQRPEFGRYVAAALVIKPMVFLCFGLYQRYWRYASIQDLAVVVWAATVSILAMAAYVALSFGELAGGFSRIVLFNDWLMTLATAGGLRVAVRLLTETASRDRGAAAGKTRRVLVVGAGAAGTMVVREMRRNPQLGMQPAGFLDDDIDKVGKYLAGVRVLGSTADLADAVRASRIDHVLIAMPTARGAAVRNVVNSCRVAGVPSQIIPGVFELIGGRASVSRMRTVEIADLLRRAPVMRETDTGIVTGRVVLITGAGGSIGYELARQVANASPARLVLLGHGENSLFEAEARLRLAFPSVPLATVIADTRDNQRLALIFDQVRPQVVFHAAAHKHVPLMEENPEEAVTNNVTGTRNVVNQAVRVGTDRLVLISTDKAVSPTSIMGATKRVAEAIVRRAAQETGRAFVVVRFGNVLGSRGSVVNTFKEQIERGGPVTVTHPEMTRFFMTIPEAVHLVLQATEAGKGGELFVLDMGEPVKIVDLVRDLIVLSGLEEDEITVVYRGMRPGEKLHERLYDAGYETRPTPHPDVLEVIGADPCVSAALPDLVQKLEQAARHGDRKAITCQLTDLVPGFVHTPSPEPEPRSAVPIKEAQY